MNSKLTALLPLYLCAFALLPFHTKAETYAGLADMSRKVTAEGIVLLKNDQQRLPLQSDEKIALFGRIQVDYFACGYGSGGDVKTPYTVSLLEALRQHPDIHIDETLARRYERWCKEHPPEHGSWGNWPLNHPEMPLDPTWVKAAAKENDRAIVIIGRSAGEDRETKLEPGSYYLTEAEKQMLRTVTDQFDDVIVLLNSGNIFDMAWLESYPQIDALLYIWQGGMQGAKAVADILSGDLSPSGKLTATIAQTYEDYPTSGMSNGEKVFGGYHFSDYVEDIYVGYRYFETFAKEKVLYPFGYGLSYTDFKINTDRIHEEKGVITLDLTVTNTGKKYSGKEVVQVYYGAPQGKLGKAARSLIAYAKTGTLAPGESEKIQLLFKVADMASYDEAGKTGYKSAYVLEAGRYPIYVGNSVRDAAMVGVQQIKQLRLVEQLSQVAAPDKEEGFRKLYPRVNAQQRVSPAYERVTKQKSSIKRRIEAHLPKPITPTKDQGITLLDVYEKRATMNQFIAQLSFDELEALSRGDYNMGSPLGAPGNAGVYGGVSASLREKGVVPVTAIDGPSGIRLTASASLLPVGTTLACTWNDALVETLYAWVGKEMLLNEADALLAPGMNLQRDPLCGRNFEYFSEDPLLTGQMGINVVRGLQSTGVLATPKHFLLNNQETRRNQHDSRCSERALREIYGNAFEQVIKKSDPALLMASYNKINGVYSHYHYDLFTTLLRQEWGYKGAVVTDWWIQPGKSPDNEKIYDNAYRVQAQVDVLMPGVGPRDGDQDRSLLDSYTSKKGITLGELQRNAKNVLRSVMKSPAFRKKHALPLYQYTPQGETFIVNKEVESLPLLKTVSLNQQSFRLFNPYIYDYEIFTPSGTPYPEISATAAPGTAIEITPPTDTSSVATLSTSNEKATSLYRIYFTNRAGIAPVVEDPIFAHLNQIYINGEPLVQFYPTEQEYWVPLKMSDSLSITADPPEGVTYRVDAYPEHKEMVIRSESIHHAQEYTLYFDPEIARNERSKKVHLIKQQGTSRIEAEEYLYATPPIQTQSCSDDEGGLNVAWIEAKNYLLYRIHVEESGTYVISTRIASNASSLTQCSYQLEEDGHTIASFIHGGTEGWQNWKSMSAKPTYLEAGTHTLRIFFNTDGINLNYLEFTPVENEEG